jgi:NitT/TauT family transport system substrate-binding protein
MIRRVTVWASSLLVAGLLLGGTRVPAQPVTHKVTLRLNVYSYGEHAAFAYGVDKGIYAEEGIDLTLIASRTRTTTPTSSSTASSGHPSALVP